MGIPEAPLHVEDDRHDIQPRGRQALIGRRVTVESAAFSGPLPAPSILAEYDQVVPGLAREIVDQWKAETQHRHVTVTSIRSTDHDAMIKYYEAEQRGQRFSIAAILGVLAVAIVAIAFDRPVVGVAGLLTGGAAAIWAMRRRSDGADVDAPIQLDDANLAG
jgi:uncharacterized membrane protein